MSKISLASPAYATLETPEQPDGVRLDVYEARRVLADAQSKKTEAERFELILTYLAGKLQCDRSQLAENQAIDFNDLIVATVGKLAEERKKKAASIVSFPVSTTSTPANGP